MRTRLTTRIASTAVVTAVILSATACGAVKDQDGSTTETTTTEATSEPAAETQPADDLHAQLPAEIASSGVIKVATGASYPPDQYIDEDGTTIVGWSVDILNEVGDRLGVEMDIANLDFPGILPAIQAGRFDIGSSSYAVTPDRVEAVDFVTYYQNGQFVAVAKGNPDGVDASDVCGRSMAVTQGSLSEKTSEVLSQDCTAEGKPALEVQSYANASAVYLALASERAQITVVNGSTLGNLPDDIEPIGDSFLPSTVGFIFEKQAPELRDAVHAALELMIEDGSYLSILEEWGIENGALDKSEVVTS